MAKRTTKTEVVTKALARSGPEITPEQIRLSDDAQPDKNKVFTQRDYNESVNAGGGGGGGGGGVAPDLKDYAKTDYVDAGDAALDGKIAAVAKDLDVVENDYTTTAEFNIVSKKANDNKKEIAALQDAFDTAVKAAQDGAENLEIELQSYAKKEDIPEGGDTPTLDEVCQKGAVTTATIGCSGLSTTGVIDAHCKWHDVPYANFQGSDAKADLTIQDRVVTVGDTTRSEAATLNVHGSVNATEFVGDGSKLTGLPSGSSVRYPIKEVLAEGNVAEAGQSLHFRVTEGDIPPFKRDSINIQGGSGLRLGGLVSTYSINESFEIDTEHGVTIPFDSCVNRISGADIYIYGNHPKLDGRVVQASIGLNGITYSGLETSLDIEPGYVRFAVGEYLKEHFKIVAGSDSSSVKATEVEATTVTATEFIGDGSKLTGLPTGGAAAPALPGHKWKLIPYSAAEKPGPGEMMHDDASQTYLLNAVDADGIVLGNATGVFDAYSVNGTMCVSLFKQGTGLEGFFKAAAVALKTELGKTFFHIVEANHARLNLEEGQTYSITASGLF